MIESTVPLVFKLKHKPHTLWPEIFSLLGNLTSTKLYYMLGLCSKTSSRGIQQFNLLCTPVTLFEDIFMPFIMPLLTKLCIMWMVKKTNYVLARALSASLLLFSIAEIHPLETRTFY